MARHRDPLPRLNINIPPPLNAQQPRGQPLYSPALPTTLQQSFHPSLQTPMQNFFPPQPPPAPGRPTHNAAHHSIAQLAAVGIHPPSGLPYTPLGGHFPRASIAALPVLGQPHPHQMAGAGGPPSSQHPFPNRNRRQLSIGGPPKAVLGGPARKVSPIPPPPSSSGTATPAAAPAPPPAPVPKPKKVPVNLPKETVPSEEDGQPPTRPEWARDPIPIPFGYEDMVVPPVETTSAEEFPPASWRQMVPPTIDVFLPGKAAWQTIKQQAIEEKLEKLGVERGGNVPQIHAPHGRAASISSPADPALLFFKLNKLQQSQLSSSNNGSPLSQSLSTSPQPPFLGPNINSNPVPGFSPSPTAQPQIPRFITNRHGHSLSLAQPSSGSGLTHPQNSLLFRTPSAGATGNPFGPNAVLGSDQANSRKSISPGPSVGESEQSQNQGDHGSSQEGAGAIHAPQGRAPVVMSSLVVPPLSAISRPDSKPDFIRGFGLDIPEEEEEEEEEYDHIDRDRVQDEESSGDEGDEGTDAMTEEGTAPHTRHHSRHESRLSAALSLRSFGGLVAEGLNERFGVTEEGGDRNRDGRTDLKIEVRPNDSKPSDGTLQVPSVGHMMPRRNTLGAVVPPPGLISSTGVPIGSGDANRHTPTESGDANEDGYTNEEVVAGAEEEFDGVEDWTGSEDVYDQFESDGDDNESIGEWSNPSDEERARQHRAEQRQRRRVARESRDQYDSEQPRKIPPFPRPPENTSVFPLPVSNRREYQDQDEYISNPSDEEGEPNRAKDMLGLDVDYWAITNAMRTPSLSSSARPLPPVPHSRGPSGQHSVHDPARAHSRDGSLSNGNEINHPGIGGIVLPSLPPPAAMVGNSTSLNPNAKPFVFGTGGPSFVFGAPASAVHTSSNSNASGSGTVSASGVPPNAPHMTHSRLPSFGKPLNAAAQEFKPAFTFRFDQPSPSTTTPATGMQAKIPHPLTLPASNVPPPSTTATAPTFPSTFPVPTPGFPVPSISQDGSSRPLPVPPSGIFNLDLGAVGGAGEDMDEGSPFKVQGREKRQRRDSDGSVVEEGNSMASFKFPNSTFDSPASLKRSPRRRGHGAGSGSLRGSVGASGLGLGLGAGLGLGGTLGPGTENPFTLANISNAKSPRTNYMLGLPSPEAEETLKEEEDRAKASEEDLEEEEGQDQGGLDDEALFSMPTSGRTKRAPIPLDFKHPVSNNTVPAALFKTLVSNGEERTRRSVRSRLSSREIFEHVNRPSLDDLNMPPISHKVSRTRLVTDPGNARMPLSPTDDIFASANRHSRRRSSLPENIRLSSPGTSSDSGSDMSEESSLGIVIPSVTGRDLTSRLEMRRYEDMLKALLDEKFAEFVSKTKSLQQSLTPKAEEMISDVVSLFRTQLQESAARSLEDSQADARGDLDFELIKDIVEQGQEKVMELMRRELALMGARGASAEGGSVPDLSHALEHYSSRTVGAVVEAISEMSSRLETITHAAPSREQDQIVDAVVSALTPIFNSYQPDAVDYDYLTEKLSQAVKPHITQIIDLASDKRETAGLIVDRLLPSLLTAIRDEQPAIDTDALALQLTTEVRRAIQPIDAFEIKEQVADLVVERLDSRLAVRDKSFNVDTVSSKVTEDVTRLLTPLDGFSITLTNIMEGQRSLASQQSDLSSAHQHVVEVMSDLPSKVIAAVETLKVAESAEKPAAGPDPNIFDIKAVLGDVSSAQKVLTGHSTEVLALSQDLLAKVSALPESILSAVEVLKSAHTDVLHSRDMNNREMEELRKANTEYQVQMAKARGAHGQVRVEKDVLSEKLGIVEADRDKLRTQVKELQAAANAKASEVSVVEAKNTDLEEALATALARLQASDVATQTNQDRIAELEKSNQELLNEKQAMKVKIDSFELKMTFANRDKESSERSLASLQKQYDEISSQQGHWESLRRASEQIEMLTSLIGQADNEELKELRRVRDRSKVLEGEHAALQKRFNQLETKATSNEKATASAKQSLSQAQQRATEWEKRAREYEAQLERTKTELEQTEQTHVQMQTDYASMQSQLEEHEANARLAQNQETRLRDEIAALEAKATLLQKELEKAKTAPAPASRSVPKVTNGYAYPRPDSRASTMNGDRSMTPNGNSHRSATPTNPSVWDSMHAPSGVVAYGYQGPQNIHAPKSRYPSNIGRGTPRASYSRAQAPSPTPSTTSAFTVDEEGWIL
ncbi:hypothetical protein K435DRAFT_969104 [Dendrothele bispora CBS 962.96]|uniref:Uncharacterized protein n=1 Tax=Dendrothele bispora (strain CBS 962.96) TaxID=1314807 RepID=A0A4S8LL94_DENBC|nr:hypothetical protein K435DRAFT_969104 [Dendrothele bispora CBS 962.96]